MTGGAFRPLDELCHVEYGTRVVKKRDGAQGYPVYGGGGETFQVGTFNREDRLVVARFGMSPECTRFVSGKFFLNDSGLTVSPKNGSLLPRFVDYQLLSLNEKIFSLGKGSAQKNLDLPAFRAVPIFVPSDIGDQQRIVSILDKAFEGIATVKSNAEQNLQNARALFESYLQSVFTQRGEGWVERRLGDVVARLTNGYVGPTRNIYHESGIPYLLARHVKDNRLLFDGRTFITEQFNRKNKKSMLKEGDVLLVQSGHIGHSAVVTAEHEGHNCHAMIVITPVEGAFIGPFLSLFFNTSGMKQKFQEIRSGSTVPHLTCGEVRELTVALPDLNTQQRLVDRSLELQAESQRVGHLFERKTAALQALKKSLLHQAFTGNL